MGKLKGTKAAMLRQMGERGELGPRLPAKVERKTPVKATPELLREACDRFAAGETLTAICLDEHMPTRQSLYLFSLTDPRHEEMWATSSGHLLLQAAFPIRSDISGPLRPSACRVGDHCEEGDLYRSQFPGHIPDD